MNLKEKLNRYFNNELKEFEKLFHKEQFVKLLNSCPSKTFLKDLIKIGYDCGYCDKEGNIVC